MSPAGRLALILAIAAAAPAWPHRAPVTPLALHPDNPRYFLFRGRPAVLISSAEHYGAVLNLDFDSTPYLNELRRWGLNQTRCFSGAYVENSGAFRIAHNTLAPAPGRLACPWARSDSPGYAGGGNRFDLARWDPAYFRRLRDYCEQAGRRGVVVELVLFCPFYNDAVWDLSPMKARNNVNGVGNLPRAEVYTLKDAALQAVQDAMTRKIVGELAEFDNVYYETCNEPYFGGVTLEWQRHIAGVISETEAGLPRRHLIAQNIANGSRRVEEPDPAVSIFNFHYSAPPDSVAQNDDLKRAIAFDETGFKGTGDLPYRSEGWDFILAGGGVYSNLDYSFTVAHPDGTAPVTEPTPGGGGPNLRRQLATLREFISGFDFVRMTPLRDVVQAGVPPGATARVLGDPGRAYALYLKGGSQANLELALPAGSYRAEWINPRTGALEAAQNVEHGGRLQIASPPYVEDLALRLQRRGPAARR